jgi:thiamine-phosphate pyrophosphorylase
MRRCISSTPPPRACRRAPDVDAKLLAWGRAAASRSGYRRGLRIPPVWLFTDSQRLPDPRSSVARLPRGLAGVVFRHDDHPDRAGLGRDLARICRARRLILVVAGDVRLAAALRAGVHLRGGHWPGPIRTKGFVTSSAHGFADLRRASRAGAQLAFLSPVFDTASHPGATSWGAARWSGFARAAPGAVAALGGVDGASVRRLPCRLCRGVGAIGALA